MLAVLLVVFFILATIPGDERINGRFAQDRAGQHCIGGQDDEWLITGAKRWRKEE